MKVGGKKIKVSPGTRFIGGQGRAEDRDTHLGFVPYNRLAGAGVCRAEALLSGRDSAADYKLMSKAELLRYQDRLEDELVRVGTGGSFPEGVSRETYAGDLKQRMKDVQHEIGLRNIWERKSYWERREMDGPTR